MDPLGGVGLPPQLLTSLGWVPVLREHSLGFGERRRGAACRAALGAGSAFIIVRPAPGTGWGAGRDGGLKRAIPSAALARSSRSRPRVFLGRLPRARLGAGSWRRKRGWRSKFSPPRAEGDESWRAQAAPGAPAGRDASAPPTRSRDSAPGPAPSLHPPLLPPSPAPPTRPRSGLRALWGKRPLCAEAAASAAAPAGSPLSSRLSPACPATRRRRA